MSSGPARPPAPPLLVLLAAVLAMSWAGPLTRLAAAPALAIAAWRMVFSVGMTGGLLLATAEAPGRLGRREWLLAAGAGVLLAAHFWSWIASLDYTSVASSVVLVSTQPLFVALLSALLLGERATPRQWLGIGIAVAGAAVIGWGDFAAGPDPLFGDALALAGAVFAAGYYVIGRRLRPRLGLWSYVTAVYGIAALVLLALAALHPDVALLGHRRADWLIFLALAAGPMLIGHTGINYTLRYLPAYVANLATLGEPIGATLIAWLLPAIAEAPQPQLLLGGALILLGIGLGTARARGGA